MGRVVKPACVRVAGLCAGWCAGWIVSCSKCVWIVSVTSLACYCALSAFSLVFAPSSFVVGLLIL